MVELFAAVALTFTGAVLSPGDWNSTIASSAPLNWYRLDESTRDVAIDYGSEGLDGVYGTGVNAPVREALGAVGGAVEFDGDRKNIVLRGSTLSGDWSAEFILKRTGSKVSSELIRGAHLESPSSHLKLEQYPNTGQVGFTESFAADRVFTPPVVAPLGRFIHLVIVKNNAGTQAYVDGALSGSSPSSVSLSRYQLGDTENEAPFAVIDEVVIYNRALSAAEIAQHFQSIPNHPHLPRRLSGWAFWLCDGGERPRTTERMDVARRLTIDYFERRDATWEQPPLVGRRQLIAAARSIRRQHAGSGT